MRAATAISLVSIGLVVACSPIQQQSNLIKPPIAGKPYAAGIGDVVMNLRQTQSLPNVAGKADLFGRTRDAGRINVRLIGIEGSQAFFVRQDVAIQSNETTMTRTPMAQPTYQTANVAGNIGMVPVSATGTTTGITYLPPTPSSSYPIQAGQVRLVAPVGGSLLVEGYRINVLRTVDGGIEYSVNEI